LREKLHCLRLGESVSGFSSQTAERLIGLEQQLVSRGSEATWAAKQALGMLAGSIRQEARVMAYGDCFFILGAMLFGMIVVVWFCHHTKTSTLDLH
jgi:DHA2 family multidrug resistance protein